MLFEDSWLSWLPISASRPLVTSELGPLDMGDVTAVLADWGRGDMVDDLVDGSSDDRPSYMTVSSLAGPSGAGGASTVSGEASGVG